MSEKDKSKKTSDAPEDLRTKILMVARKHFAKHGFQGANLNSIAKEAGIANSLINYHFSDKEGLFLACMEPFARGRTEAIFRILGEVNTREEFKVRLQLFSEEILDAYLKDPYGFDIIDRELRSENPIILKIFENTMLKAFRAVVEFFKEAKAGGLLREDVDPLIASSLLFTCCYDAIKKDVLAKRFFGVSFHNISWRKTFSSHIAELFLNGVVK